MANRITESRNSPLIAPNASVALTSGVSVSPIACTKLVMYFSAAGNLTIKTLDGNSVTINSVAGLVVLDVQFDTVTWTGTATGAGFYTE